jgi:hypothetical protein
MRSRLVSVVDNHIHRSLHKFNDHNSEHSETVSTTHVHKHKHSGSEKEHTHTHSLMLEHKDFIALATFKMNLRIDIQEQKVTPMIPAHISNNHIKETLRPPIFKFI